ncbi:MAG: alpha/beta hydrolase [Kofleriaceae bacterium]
MTAAIPQVLFIQGGGAGTHDEYDSKLVDSLKRDLAGWEVRYPRMANEDDPSAANWGPAIERELAALDAGAVLIGHSVGGTLLIHALSGQPPTQAPAAIVLIAAPFVGADGWSSDELQLSPDLGARLPAGVPVHVFHGSDDQTVPPTHADLYARAIPHAQIHRLPGRDHQLNDSLSEVAKVLRTSLDR